MKLASVGIDPDPVGFVADHVSIHDSTELLEISLRRLFYYVILEAKPQVFFFDNSTRKMKLASAGIDPDHVEICCRPRFDLRFHWAIADVILSTILLSDSKNKTPGFF